MANRPSLGIRRPACQGARLRLQRRPPSYPFHTVLPASLPRLTCWLAGYYSTAHRRTDSWQEIRGRRLGTMHCDAIPCVGEHVATVRSRSVGTRVAHTHRLPVDVVDRSVEASKELSLEVEDRITRTHGRSKSRRFYAGRESFAALGPLAGLVSAEMSWRLRIMAAPL